MADIASNAPVPTGFRPAVSTWWRRWRQPAPSATLDFPFAASDVMAFGGHTAGASGAAPDQKTWDDLLLQPYLARLSVGTSIFGQQMLDRSLRHGDVATPAAIARVQALVAAPDQLTSLQQACRPLRQADAEVSTPLFGPAPSPAPWWSRRLSLVPLALLVMVLVAGALSMLTHGVAGVGRRRGLVDGAAGHPDPLPRRGGNVAAFGAQLAAAAGDV